MALPSGLTTITVTGDYTDATGSEQSGSVSFTPTSAVYDASGKAVLTATAVTASLSGGSFSTLLVATDSAGLTPSGWAYGVNVAVAGAQAAFTCWIPSTLGGTTATVDITELSPIVGGPAPTGAVYLPDASVVPTAGPSGGGGYLYSQGGALYWLSSASTLTKLADN